jgi:hypothetical protein
MLSSLVGSFSKDRRLGFPCDVCTAAVLFHLYPAAGQRVVSAVAWIARVTTPELVGHDDPRRVPQALQQLRERSICQSA